MPRSSRSFSSRTLLPRLAAWARLRGVALVAVVVLLVAGHAGAQPSGDIAKKPAERVTIALNDTPIGPALAAISGAANIQIIRRGKIPDTEKVTLFANEDPIDVLMNKLVGSHDWVWRYDESKGAYELWDKASYEQQVVATLMIDKTFSPRYIKAEEIMAALQPLINIDKGGNISVDPRTNKIFVRDLPEVVQEVARLIEELDVNLVTRVFRIRHAEINALAEKMAVYKSTPGTIDVDEKTHQIIVTDIEQNIKRMELLVDVLDVGPELRVYDLNNIGFEGIEIEELRATIERIVTPDAFFEINYQSGTLLLEDVEEVHEKVELLLDAFDPPPKQVLIEAEIIETNFNRNLSYGTDWFFSEDMFGATQDGLFGDIVPTGATQTADNPLGFLNFREEFPILSSTAGSLSVLNLSSHALVSLRAALTDTDTQVLLQPRLIVKNQKTASIEVGGEEPISNPVFNNEGQLISTTRSSVREGLYLELRPSISNNGLVEIEILFENNDAESEGVDGQGNPLVRRSTQEIETVLVIPSGETRVIGGLLVNSKSDTDAGIPFLVDIPWIGPLLFGSKDNINAQRHIMVFITPSIIQEQGHRARVRRRPFSREALRNLMTGDKSPEDRDDPPAARGIPADLYGAGGVAPETPPLTVPAEEGTEGGAAPAMGPVARPIAPPARPGETASVGEVIEGRVPGGDLPTTDAEGNPIPPPPSLMMNDLGIEFDDEGNVIVPPAAATDDPGPEAPSLLREGTLGEDHSMRETLREDPLALDDIPADPSNYVAPRRTMGSTGTTAPAGGGARPGMPGAGRGPAASQGAPGRQTVSPTTLQPVAPGPGRAGEAPAAVKPTPEPIPPTTQVETPYRF